MAVPGFGGDARDAAPSGRPGILREVHEETELEAALGGAGPAVIYKHSDRCGFCHRSQREMEDFARRHPEIPVLKIDVVGSRPLSSRVAERLGVKHQSPQAIVVRGGEAVWHTSHSGVTADQVAEVVA